MFDKRRSNKNAVDHDRSPGAAQMPVMASTPSPSPAGKVAVIGPGICIAGDISGTDNLLIEGQVKGSIKLDAHEVTIGKTGQVSANVTAMIIRVSGTLQGDLIGQEKVIISGTGNVRGNVVAPRVVLEDGAIFRGSIDMDPNDKVLKQPAAQPGKPTSGVTASSASVPTAIPKTADLGLKSG